ncbi:hypothetical protein MNB_SV-13-1311 [hydrothermal vent metagenome]|uniref:PD-(D/E)XK nuclease superfamily protein n=1 Tax=hydrothermal vent metagenome TaxID=652676 RepID=A0A1W1CVX6_9ZZZZ
MGTVDEKYLKLLEKFQNLSKSTYSQTIFDVAGYPHYENVASNILAFFLNPNNEHGLDMLVLSSLLSLVDINNTNQTNVQVSREKQTLNNGRIDIVVETDSLIIGIENKIYAHLTNDFEDYSNSIKQWANGREVIKIILGIKKEQEPSEFKSITYDRLFTKVRERLGRYVTTSSQKWLLYFIDFMNTIEQLQGGNMEFDENDKFFMKNGDLVESLVVKRNEFLLKLNNRVEQLKYKIGKVKNCKKHCKKQWIYKDSCLVHEFVLSDHLIIFDLYISYRGWELQLFERDDKSNLYLKELISIGKPFNKDNFEYINSRYIIEHFSLDTELSKIGDKLLEWFRILLDLEKNYK